MPRKRRDNEAPSYGATMDRREAGGRHTGRGPRTYRRSDDSIRDEICEVLTNHGDLDASEIEIVVAGGEVTLGGSVETRDEKYLAEELAEMTSGVRQVFNEIRVARR